MATLTEKKHMAKRPHLNLFTGDVEQLRLEDVDAFLALDGPPDSRPREGIRVDYKGDIPDKLGETVAAFSNTYGGLILLGVSETEGVPSRRDGFPQDKRDDIKTRLANIICTTVHPRPRFQIGVVPVDASAQKHVAVIRIEEGDYPPYMFTRSGANKIPIRVADKDHPADLRTVEALFARRSLFDSAGRPQRSFPSDELYVLDHYGHGEPQRADSQLRLWVRPHRPLRLHLDNTLETKVIRVIASATNTPIGSVTQRKGDYFQTTWTAPQPQNDEHVWRVGSDGSVGFATHIVGTLCADRIFLQDIVDHVLRFFTTSSQVLADLEYPGRVELELALRLSDFSVVAMPVQGDSQQRPARLWESEIPPTLTEQPWFLSMEPSELENPVEIVATALNEQLRNLRGADIDLEQFRLAVDARWQSVKGGSA